jgi:hypothetical protein
MIELRSKLKAPKSRVMQISMKMLKLSCHQQLMGEIDNTDDGPKYIA